MTGGIEKRAAWAAELAAQAVRAGVPFKVAPGDSMADVAASVPEMPAPAGKKTAANIAPAAPSSVSRDDKSGFLKNLEGIAAGKVSVTSSQR